MLTSDETGTKLFSENRWHNIPSKGYIPSMAWGVEFTDEFEAWWVGLDEEEQIAERIYEDHLKSLEGEPREGL